MSTFNLPDLGEGLQEAEIVAWHVAEGDHVVLDQPLVSVETEKAVVEIPSPKAGHDRTAARASGRAGEGRRSAARFRGGRPPGNRHRCRRTREANATATKAAVPASTTPPETVRATPAVRARAKELGVDLASLKGSGPDGAITRADVGSGQHLRGGQACRERLRGARKTMASNMARAWREVAHATLHDQADIEVWTPPEDVTVRLIRAIVAGCMPRSRR